MKSGRALKTPAIQLLGSLSQPQDFSPQETSPKSCFWVALGAIQVGSPHSQPRDCYIVSTGSCGFGGSQPRDLLQEASPKSCFWVALASSRISCGRLLFLIHPCPDTMHQVLSKTDARKQQGTPINWLLVRVTHFTALSCGVGMLIVMFIAVHDPTGSECLHLLCQGQVVS